MRTKLAAALTATLLGLTAGALAGGSAAQAATSCSGPGCRGLNPMSTTCASDAVTLVAHEYQAEAEASFRVEVRYSRSCNAAWGRLVVYSDNGIGFAPSAWNPNTASVSAIGHDGNTTWTAMIDGSPQDCAGTQFYVNNNWVRWYYVGCA